MGFNPKGRIMFIILNRLRGTVGAYSKFIGMLMAYVLYSVFNNHYVALSVGILYVIGECFKWGTPVGELTVHRLNLWYNRVWLFFRGLLWWACLLPLIYFIDWRIVAVAIIILGLAFPVACEIGYQTAKIWNFKYMNLGWEHQEIWYGLFQGVVFFSLIWGAL